MTIRMTVAKLYLPKEADNYDKALELTKRRMCDIGGGYTTYDGHGGWRTDDGELIEEPVTVLEVVENEGRDVNYIGSCMKELAHELKDITGESAVMVVSNGEKYLA